MNEWHNVYITDVSGKKFFNTQASPMAPMSEIRNLSRHMDAIKAGAKGYEFIDKSTAKLMLDDEPWKSMDDILDDDLLAELMG